MRYAVTIGAAGEGRDPSTMAALAELAEEAGWDALFLEDYVVYRGNPELPTYDPWVVLAAMATRTTRIRLGTNVTPVPRRRPWKLAAEAVTLDHLSGGRVILGVGLGDLSDPGFGAVGEPTDRRLQAEVLEEGLELLERLWSGQEVTYEGKHHQVTGLRLAARPVQRPRIPVWVGGDWRVAGVRRRAARWGDGCQLLNVTSPDAVREVRALVERERGSAEGFDVAVPRQKGIVRLCRLAEAGATWSNDWIPPAGLEATRRVLRRGPLRVD
jgi:alkanesulfonate monooxygenase SsuD/methylene tetrahydromethanopterin reductase-like flavin-dependent oxidoreductase (luciferase family)